MDPAAGNSCSSLHLLVFSTGFLAKDWHSSSTRSLGELSFDLHLELASEGRLNGKENYGYREIGSFGVECQVPNYAVTSNQRASSRDSEKTARNRLRSCENKERSNDSWIDTSTCQVDRLSTSSSATTAQINPLQFVQLLFKECQEMGVEYMCGRVEGVRRSEEDISNIKAVKMKKRDVEGLEEIQCHKLVLCCGPWIGKLSRQLFGKDTKDTIQIKELPGQSIILRPNKSTSIPSDAIFASVNSSFSSSSPEIFPRPDGSIYVAGDNVGPALPSSVDEVDPETQEGRAAAKRLFNSTAAILPSVRDDYEIVDHKLCYRPIPFGSRRNVILSRFDVGSGKNDKDEKSRERLGNVFVSAGHGPWGISLAPGTGKCLAELVLTGKVVSADVDMLQL